MNQWQRGEIGIGLLKIEKERAKDRQLSHLKQGDKIPVKENLPEREGQARDIAAKKVGISGKQLDKVVKIKRGRKAMRKGLLLCIVLVLVMSLRVFAFENEPEGFRDLKWGDSPTEEMKYLGDVFGEGYVLVNDKMSIGNAKFFIIIYIFYENRFFAVGLYFQGQENYEILKIICEECYGQEYLNEGFYQLKWQSDESFVVLHYDIEAGEGFLSLASTIIALDREKKTLIEADTGVLRKGDEVYDLSKIRVAIFYQASCGIDRF